MNEASNTSRPKKYNDIGDKRTSDVLRASLYLAFGIFELAALVAHRLLEGLPASRGVHWWTELDSVLSAIVEPGGARD